jgi:hypothetical protein
MDLEWRDFVLISLGFFAILIAIYRIIIFNDFSNLIVSVIIIFVGVVLFFIVYTKQSSGSGNHGTINCLSAIYKSQITSTTQKKDLFLMDSYFCLSLEFIYNLMFRLEF